MGIFVQLVDYVEDKSLHGYYLFGTTLALIFLGIFLLLIKEWSIHSPTKLPIVGVESKGYFARVKARQKFLFNGFQMVRDAYYKNYGKGFVVSTNSYDKVILTHAQVRELSNAPDDSLSLAHASARTLMAEYTGMNRFVGTGYVRDATKTKLTQNIGNMIGPLIEETKFALDRELPACTSDEPVPVDIVAAVIRIVARVSARSFIGLPLCRDEDWLAISIAFTGDIFKTAMKLNAIPKLIRPFYAYIWNSAKIIENHKTKAQSLLTPIVRKRFEEKKLAEKNGEAYQNPNDLLEWLTDLVEPRHKTADALSDLQLAVSLASIHTTSSTFVNTILDLAEHQECIQPLREEMETAIIESGGVLDREAIRKMRKADSFFRESMRTRSFLFTFNRMTMKNLTLSDGTYLPKGTLLGAPNAMFSSDPGFIDNPETFDGFRWYKRSLEAGDTAPKGNGCAATSASSLAFGHGKHACTGRYFAVEEMKIMLAYFVLQYDIKYPEGQSRPDDIVVGEFSFPDSTQKVMFKRLPGPKKFSFL
ncbi:cytochrome P450 [Tuber indicum]|nr:cytochrome P450 [Tuber indicum]